MPNNPTLSKSIWPFSPQSIASCVLWLDAADSNSVQLSGDSVTQWTDKSGQGNNATTSYPPTYVANSQNNLATISFNGASTYFDCPLTVDFSTHCLFAVHNPITADPNSPPNASGGNTSIFRFQNTNGYVVFPYTNGGAYGYINDHGGFAWGTLPDVSSTGTFQIISANISSGNSVTYMNGVKQGSVVDSIGGGQSDTLSIGAYGVASNQGEFYWGSIAEIIVFSCHLTDEERHQVDGYLAWKWNIGPLPTGHPYYGRPVFSRTFQPVDIPGCQLWLDGADQSSMTFGSNTTVTVWNDKSGRGANATSAGYDITYSSAGLYFGGVNYYMNVPGIAGTIANTPFVIFIVETLNTTANNSYMLGDDAFNGEVASLLLGYRTPTAFTMAFYGSDIEAGGLGEPGTTRIWTCYLPASSNRNLRLNGSTVTTGDNNTQLGAFTTPVLGRVFGAYGNFYYTGIISEMIIYTGDIGLSQIQQVEAYLASKWNLQQSLPSTHPGYRLSAYSVAKTINITFSPIALTNLGVWLDPSNFETFTLSGSNVTDITSKALDDSQNNQWYSPSGGVTQRTINDRTAFGFTGGCLRNDSVYFPNGYNMSIFTIAQIPAGVYSINIFAKGIYVMLKTDGIDIVIQSDDTSNGANFYNSNGNQMPTSVNKIYFISLVITTPENPSQASCYCTINGVQLSMQGYQNGSSIPYGTETYLLTDFGDAYPYDTRDLTAGESIIYKDNKSIAECQRIEGYLAWKWGAQSLLPSIHPYAFTTP